MVANSIPLSDRKKVLQKILKGERGRLELVAGFPSQRLEDIRSRFELAVKNREEGIVLKREDSLYNPGKRDAVWVKLKADYLDGYAVDYDLLVIGGYFGQGSRRIANDGDWLHNISHFLLGLVCRLPSGELALEPLCKVASGLSMNDLSNVQQKLAANLLQTGKSLDKLPAYFKSKKFPLDDFPDAYAPLTQRRPRPGEKRRVSGAVSRDHLDRRLRTPLDPEVSESRDGALRQRRRRLSDCRGVHRRSRPPELATQARQQA